MPITWDKVAQDDEVYRDVNDYKQAAYQLVTEQILYESNPAQRKSYRLARRHYNQFKEALALLGLDLFHNESYRFLYTVPREIRQVAVSLDETLLILVLRQLYHERASKGELEEGRAIVAIEDLHQAFSSSTKRELPSTAVDLRSMIHQLRRYGIARTRDAEEGSLQPFDVVILPGIADVVNEAAVSKLGAYLTATNSVSLPQEVDDENA